MSMTRDFPPTAVNERLERYFRNLGNDLADTATVQLPPQVLDLSLDAADGDRRTIAIPGVCDTRVVYPSRVDTGGLDWENHLGEALATMGWTLGISPTHGYGQNCIRCSSAKKVSSSCRGRAPSRMTRCSRLWSSACPPSTRVESSSTMLNQVMRRPPATIL